MKKFWIVSGLILGLAAAPLAAQARCGMRGGSMGRGGMNGRGMGQGMGTDHPNIKLSSVQLNSAGTQITASVQILSSAVAGTCQVRLETDHGEVTEPIFSNLFRVTKQNTIYMGVTS